MQKKCFFQISPFLVFFVCLGLYFGRREYILFGVLAAAAHEMGHFFYLLAVGKTPKKLFLASFSAVMEAKPLSYTEELLCALCGPLVNLLCCVIFLTVRPVLAGINLALAMYNILPIFPLDGGRILRAVLLLHFEELCARRIVFYVNFFSSLVVMFLAVWLCTVLQCPFWPVVAVGMILLKLDADARREWH